MSDRPKTLDELNALPVGGGFGKRLETRNGERVWVPYLEPLIAVYHAPDDVIEWSDAEGNRWRIARFADGRWCKRPVWY